MKVTYLVFTVLALSACDNRLDFLEGLNHPPNIQILTFDGQSHTNLSDSLKTSLKTGNDRYQLQLVARDAERSLVALTPRIIAGSGKFYQSGAEVQQLAFDENGFAIVAYRPADETVGTIHTIEVLAVDNLGAIGTAKLTLNVFVNQPPVAAFTLTQLDVNQKYEFELDATGSYDPDKRQGGGIHALEWTINGKVFTDPLVKEEGESDSNQKTRIIFEGKGTYEIRLVAIDNDGARSTNDVTLVRTIN